MGAPTIPIPHIPPGAKCTEHLYMTCLMRALNAPERQTRLFRQNAGVVTTRDRAGKVTGQFHGAMTGAADLSGVVSVKRKWLGEDGSIHQGTLAVRLECEVKVTHFWTDVQKQYAEAIRRLGAVYCLITYDPKLTLAQNVTAGVATVDAEIAKTIPL